MVLVAQNSMMSPDMPFVPPLPDRTVFIGLELRHHVLLCHLGQIGSKKSEIEKYILRQHRI
jgi:hypothetical protein